MATTIELSQPTSLPNAQIRAAVDEVFNDLKKKYTLTGNWKNETLFIISGESIIGRLEVFDDCVTVTLTLGGMLGAFSNIIEGQIKEALEDKLSS